MGCSLTANGTRAKFDFGPLRENRKTFQIFFSANLNLNPRFESKSNTFSNSTKFKHFPKIEILNLNSKFKSRIL
jgi:hypothetical protein